MSCLNAPPPAARLVSLNIKAVVLTAELGVQYQTVFFVIEDMFLLIVGNWKDQSSNYFIEKQENVSCKIWEKN